MKVVNYYLSNVAYASLKGEFPYFQLFSRKPIFLYLTIVKVLYKTNVYSSSQTIVR